MIVTTIILVHESSLIDIQGFDKEKKFIFNMSNLRIKKKVSKLFRGRSSKYSVFLNTRAAALI